MLKNTFIHIPEVGQKTEELLWSEGILSWDDTLNINSVTGLSAGKLKKIKEHILVSKNKLLEFDASYFIQHLKQSELWRIFPEFRAKTAFIDIETTGLEKSFHYITTIALYDNSSIKYYVQGENLDDFKKDILDYSVLVTYNGKVFDIPFIEYAFDTTLPHIHIDLRWVLKSLGLTGGQKNIEKKLGIDRHELEGIDGAFAPELWKYYKKNKEKNIKALDTLLAYNIMDAINLEKLMIEGYNRKIENTPFKTNKLIPSATQPDIPFKVDVGTIQKVQNKLSRFTAVSYVEDSLMFLDNPRTNIIQKIFWFLFDMPFILWRAMKIKLYLFKNHNNGNY